MTNDPRSAVLDLKFRNPARRRLFQLAIFGAWLATSGVASREVLAQYPSARQQHPSARQQHPSARQQHPSARQQQGKVEQPKPEPAKPDAAQVKAEVVVLHATNEGKGIDPGIGKMPDLLKPPFSAYDTYKLIDKTELDLLKGAAKEKKLPDGGKLSVTLTDLVLGKKKGEVTRYVLSAAIEKPEGKAFLPGLSVNAVQGEYFFIAGQKYKSGILVIGIRIR